MAALALWPAVPTAAATFAPVTVNVDAEAHRESSPATVTLPAGTYVLTVVQGQYRAWNGWNGSTLDCNAQGSGCTRGWLTEYRYSSPSLGNRMAEFNGRFSTESLAFAAVSDGTTITLPVAETVRFWVNDSVYRDNLGGVSVRIEAIALLDTTAPAIAALVSGTLGSSGWYVSDVSVAWTVTDPESAISSTTGCEPRSVASDTAGTTFTCRATSSGGTDDESVTIKRDATTPAVSYAGNAGAYTVDQEVSITCSATDGLSGVASSTCQSVAGPAYGFALGTNAFSAAATDRAGNTGSGSTSFTVSVTADSLCALTRRFVGGPGANGISNALCAKLTGSEAAAGRGNTTAAGNGIEAYVHEAAAQSGKSLTAEEAAILTRLARAL